MAQSNIGMHPTGASVYVIGNLGAFAVVPRRVMPGVGRLSLVFGSKRKVRRRTYE